MIEDTTNMGRDESSATTNADADASSFLPLFFCLSNTNLHENTLYSVESL